MTYDLHFFERRVRETQRISLTRYGENFLNDLQAVRSGKISMQELATKMKVTKETIRFYFHRYFSETDLIGTRYFKRVPNKCQSADHVGNSVSTSLPNKRQSKIEQELGWCAETDFLTGLRKTVEWYIENEKWINSIITEDYINYFDKMYSEKF